MVVAIEIHLRRKVLEVQSQETDYGGMDTCILKNFFSLAQVQIPKNKTLA